MHVGGRRRPFPVAAEAFVRGEGAVLREEVAMPFVEIVTACQEYVLEHVEAYGARPLTEVDIAVALLRLLDWGMVRLVVAWQIFAMFCDTKQVALPDQTRRPVYRV